MMALIRLAATLYLIAFAIIVMRGRVQGWSSGVAFVYAEDETTDELLASIFAPAYWVGRRAGLQRLAAPFRKMS